MTDTDSHIHSFKNDHDNLEALEGGPSKVMKISFAANGIRTDIVICDYINKQLLVVTQYQKLGTFILVSKGNSNTLDEPGSIYDVKTIGGVDNQEYYLAARYLAEQLGICKPVLFSICLQDRTVKTLKLIVRALKESNIF